MFGIKVDFLTERYTAHSQRGYGTTEWPPHPGRFYSALVAAYHEHDHGNQERSALEWLESLPAPRLHASEARERDIVTMFVPHYDHDKIVDQGGKEELIPKYRASSNRQRTFPTVIPDGPVYFIWDGDPTEQTAAALNRLANSVPYLGDSTSLVHAQFVETPPEANFVPAVNGAGDDELRVAGIGRLNELEQAYENGQYPEPAGMVSYISTSDTISDTGDIQKSEFGTGQDLLILRIVDGPTPSLEVSYDLTATLRRAILSIVDDPVPTWISGHTPDGEPADQSHLAIIPLANIGHRWADGSTLGVGMVIPRHVPENKKAVLHEAIDRLRPLKLGSRGEVRLERMAKPTKESLKRGAYTDKSALWTTVTPYVYDRYPDSDEARDEMIAQACEHIGLPRPLHVHVIESHVSPISGVPNATDVQLSNTRFSDSPRRHVILRFDEPVRGPITIGRGRYIGIGLMRSLKEGEVA